MKYFFDTEFIEDGKTIDLISIGIAAQDGREYYAESVECDLSRASPWVRENVIPHLTQKPKTKAQIGFEIIEFVGDNPEFWAYYADYDWVALCQLYGTMMQLPKGWPMYCRDIKQLCDSVGNPRLPKPKTEHNALADANWNLEMWRILNGFVPTLQVVLDVVDETYKRNISNENWHSRVRNSITAKFTELDKRLQPAGEANDRS